VELMIFEEKNRLGGRGGGGGGGGGGHNGPNFAFVALIRLFFKLLV